MKDLKKAAEELNDVLGLVPAIKTTGKVKEPALKKLVIEAAAELVEDDKEDVSEEVQAILSGLGVELPWEASANEDADEDEDNDDAEEEEEEEEEVVVVAKSKKGKQKKEKAKKEEDEQDEEDEQEDEEDEQEDEEEEVVVDAPKAKKEKAKGKKEKAKKEEAAPAPKAKGKRPEKAQGTSGSGKGVIATIKDILSKTSKKKQVTKQDILDALVIEFPDRAASSMKSTVNAQVPGRISRETDMDIEKSADGKKFYKA